MGFFKTIIEKQLIKKEGNRYIKAFGPFGRLITDEQLDAYVAAKKRNMFVLFIVLFLFFVFSGFFLENLSISPAVALEVTASFSVLIILFFQYKNNAPYPLQVINEPLDLQRTLKIYKLFSLDAIVISIGALGAIITLNIDIKYLVFACLLGLILGVYYLALVQEAKNTLKNKS